MARGNFMWLDEWLRLEVLDRNGISLQQSPRSPKTMIGPTEFRNIKLCSAESLGCQTPRIRSMHRKVPFGGFRCEAMRLRHLAGRVRKMFHTTSGSVQKAYGNEFRTFRQVRVLYGRVHCMRIRNSHKTGVQRISDTESSM